MEEEMSQYRLYRVFVVAVIIFLFNGSAYAGDVLLTRGHGQVRVVKYKNGHWQLLLNNKPYFVKGVVYDPIKVGETLTASNLWMNYDFNRNGKCDTAYEAWVDKNNNDIQDEDELTVGDFTLLSQMGCNTMRIYHPTNINRDILMDLYKRFGIRVMMGNFMGAYTWGSGASWDKGTDYTDEQQRRNMLYDVLTMVLKYKDEPYILFWLLGNENDMVGSYENSTFNNTNARLAPQAYAEFINEVAQMIHLIDPNHPVGISNGSVGLLKYYAKYAPAVDILGFNSYKGPYGFGTLWKAVKLDFDRPVVITEYGIDCYNQIKGVIDEDFQALYHKGCWRDMLNNSFAQNGEGNSIGGFAYNWLDSWWFCGSVSQHDIEKGAWSGPSNDSWINDEWLGICGQGDGANSPFLRQLRKVYYFYKEEWGKK
ncbi:MAG: glycoside hydrolase family 2 TIM barrel-domain containing protein [Candidatus Omnitrophota bacterium]